MPSSCDLILLDEGIELSKMVYVGGSAGGDDHSERVANLTRDGDFHHDAVKGGGINDCNRIEGYLRAEISGLDVE